MKSKNQVKFASRMRRKKHISKVVHGTSQRPRLVVYRSLKHIYAQVVDDSKGIVLLGLSSLNPAVKKDLAEVKGKMAASTALGKAVAQLAKDKGVEHVVFDRNGYLYHGRIKAVAEGAREGGLIF